MAATTMIRVSEQLRETPAERAEINLDNERKSAFFTYIDTVVSTKVDFAQIFDKFSVDYSLSREKIGDFFSAVWNSNKSQFSEDKSKVIAKILYINYREQFCNKLENHTAYKQAVVEVERQSSDIVMTISKKQKGELIKERLRCIASSAFDFLHSTSAERALEKLFNMRSFVVRSSEVSNLNEATSFVVTAEHLNILWGTSQNK